MTRPVALIILDGFGIAPASRGNAISLAKKPHLDQYIKDYFVTTLAASGEAVGLAYGELGNSEVGHLAIGSGRILYQNLPRITREILDNSFFNNPAFIEACERAKEKNGALHLIGMFSSGGVHSFHEHGYALLELAKKHGVTKVFVHAILDGRDTPFDSGRGFMVELEKHLQEIGLGKIASVSGRFYAMDRDNHWERTAAAYQAMALGQSTRRFASADLATQDSYAHKIYDEELVPTVIVDDKDQAVGLVADGDSVIFFNFRADRMRQLTKAFVLPSIEKFERPKYLRDLTCVSMTEYEKDLPVLIAYPMEAIKNPLSSVLSQQKIKQLHIAETEKYAHVTFFFNGGNEAAYPGEERVIIPSPPVSAYDQAPEMSVREITKRVIQEMDKNIFDVFVINFANADMVAHTGNLTATIEAVEVIDSEVGKIVDKVLSLGGAVCITADHGNAEELVKLQTGTIDKEHSTNPVPLWLVGEQFKGWTEKAGLTNQDLSSRTPSGVLADVAPTLLKILDIPKPKDMTGISLF